jgi:hypothetical protein
VALAEDLATALAYRDQVRPTLAGTLETLDLRRQLHAAFAAFAPAIAEPRSLE